MIVDFCHVQYIFLNMNSSRDQALEFFNWVQDETKEQIVSAEIVETDRKGVYEVKSVTLKPCENVKPCISISTRMYRDKEQVHLIDFWYLNLS